MGDTTLATDLAEPLNFAYSDLISWQGRREAGTRSSWMLESDPTTLWESFDFEKIRMYHYNGLPSEDLKYNVL